MMGPTQRSVAMVLHPDAMTSGRPSHVLRRRCRHGTDSAGPGAVAPYVPRAAADTVLRGVIHEHLNAFLAQPPRGPTGSGCPLHPRAFRLPPVRCPRAWLSAGSVRRLRVRAPHVVVVQRPARLRPSGPPDIAAPDRHISQTPPRRPRPLRYSCTQGFHASHSGRALGEQRAARAGPCLAPDPLRGLRNSQE
jgi:hypothetical protein